MAKRTRLSESDSFELMLDTICNVFGGIILMSILVVIHTQVGVARISKLEEGMQDAALATRRARFEIQRTEQEIGGLKRQKKTVDESYAATVSPHTDTIVEQRQKFLEGVADAQHRLEGIRRDKTDAERNLEDTLASRIRVEQSIQAQRNELASLRRQLARQEWMSRKKVRLPLAHQSRAFNQETYVVEGNRVYPYPSHCEVSRLGARSARITPKGGAGFVVSEKGPDADLIQALASIRPTTHFVRLFVSATNESFESFQVLRRLVVGQGYDCDYSAYDPKIGLLVVQTTDRSVQ